MALTLTVLGTASPHPQPGRPCSGYLVGGETAQVWVDAGPGTFAELQRHVRIGELSAVWISHLHSDHWADLIAVEAAVADGGHTVPAPIPVYAPESCARRLAGFFGADDPEELGAVFDFRELSDGLHIDLGGLRLTSRAVRHGIEAYGLRAEENGAVLAYSGDSGPCAALRELAEGADLFLCEADINRPLAGCGPQVHLTPEDAGTLAHEARVAALLVTHVGPTLTAETARARAAKAFGGPTAIAREGQRHSVG